MIERHVQGARTYQAYVGEVAQHTAVHVGRAAQAISALARSPQLRRKMGAAGRERAKSFVDWPVVAAQYRDLADELAAIRAAAPDPATRYRADPVRRDPFIAFAGFSTMVLGVDTPLRAVEGASGDWLRSVPEDSLDNAFAGSRASLEECAQALDRLAAGEAHTVREVLLAVPVDRRRQVQMGIAWMAKLGLIDWLD